MSVSLISAGELYSICLADKYLMIIFIIPV